MEWVDKFCFTFLAGEQILLMQIGVGVRREMGVARTSCQKNDKLISFLDSQGEIF